MTTQKRAMSKSQGVRFPIEILEKIDEIARKEERRRSDVIRIAVKRFIEQYEREEKGKG